MVGGKDYTELKSRDLCKVRRGRRKEKEKEKEKEGCPGGQP